MCKLAVTCVPKFKLRSSDIVSGVPIPKEGSKFIQSHIVDTRHETSLGGKKQTLNNPDSTDLFERCAHWQMTCVFGRPVCICTVSWLPLQRLCPDRKWLHKLRIKSKLYLG